MAAKKLRILRIALMWFVDGFVAKKGYSIAGSYISLANLTNAQRNKMVIKMAVISL
jgi:hypothetical protein